MSKNFEKEISIPFHLTDPAGILFFGHIFSLYHEVYESFISSFCPWESWFNNDQWIAPIRKTECEFLAPLFAGKKYLAKVKIKNVGQSSFTVQISFESSKGPHAVVETTQVFCDKKLKSKISIPEEIKANLKQFSL